MPKISPSSRRKPLISWEKLGTEALNNYRRSRCAVTTQRTAAKGTTRKPCNRGGPPTRLTFEVHEAIVAAAGRGVGLNAIADALGIGVGTLGE
jgi:hypothetical protein